MGRKKCPHVDIVDQDQCTGSRACLPGGGWACGDNDGGSDATFDGVDDCAEPEDEYDDAMDIIIDMRNGLNVNALL